MASPKFGTTAPPNGWREKFLDDPNALNVSRRVNRTSPSEIQLFKGPLRRETPAAAAASPSMRKNNVPPSRPRRSVLVPEFLFAFRCACCTGGRCELRHQSDLRDMRTISRRDFARFAHRRGERAQHRHIDLATTISRQLQFLHRARTLDGSRPTSRHPCCRINHGTRLRRSDATEGREPRGK